MTYRFRIEDGGVNASLLFTFHGTGGDEHQFSDLARELMPSATIVSPRGDVSEGGALRFFRRTAEGVYDMTDLAMRTERMADFIETMVAQHKPRAVLAMGYSNGANILASVIFARPSLFDGVVLMHPLIPFAPQVDGTLDKTSFLITAGRKDPICPPHLTHRFESYLQGFGARLETVWHDGAHEIRPVEIEAARTFLDMGRSALSQPAGIDRAPLETSRSSAYQVRTDCFGLSDMAAMAGPPTDIGDQLIAFLPNMRRFALSLARKSDIADDLVQQACERALASAASFEAGTRFDAWMFRIIRNLWIDRTRRAKTAGPSEDVTERHDLVGEDGREVVEARQVLSSVRDALDRMPEEQREIIMLVCVDDLSYRQAAEVLSLPIGTVMSWLARARKKLAELTGINADLVRSPGSRD